MLSTASTKKQKPDLVHNFTIKPVIYGTIAARLAGVPKVVNSITGLGFVFTSKTFKARLLSLFVKHLYHFSFNSPKVKIIFQNTDDRDFFLRNRIIANNSGFLVEGSGVDVHKFIPTIQKNSSPKIFVASRLLIEKGIFEFMDALKILQKKGLKFEAVIAGDTDPANPGSISESQVKIWQESGLAHFLGFQKDMVTLLASIDIACLPSYREGLPMALLEAMAAGKPIVTTDAPGCRSTVKDARNGILVPPKDSHALAGALEQLISDPQLRERMGKESRIIAVDFFSKEKITSEIIKIYQA